jgi:hypothetical protein
MSDKNQMSHETEGRASNTLSNDFNPSLHFICGVGNINKVK